MSYLEITCFCLQSKLLCPVDLNITSYTYIYDNMCCLNEINALKMNGILSNFSQLIRLQAIAASSTPVNPLAG